MNLQNQLEEILDRVIGQYDHYAFFVGKFYSEELEDIREYCGYPVIYVPLIEEKDETIYFAPITHWHMYTMN